MKGFVRNEGDRAVFTLQRSIVPGFSITFEEAYNVVGKKSGKKRGKLFVKWLRDNVFSGNQWAFYAEEGVQFFGSEDLPKEKPEKVAEAKGAGRKLRRKTENFTGQEITATLIIEKPYPQAKNLIEKCNDRGVLKKALSLSKLRSKREDHMRHLMRRLEQVY